MYKTPIRLQLRNKLLAFSSDFCAILQSEKRVRKMLFFFSMYPSSTSIGVDFTELENSRTSPKEVSGLETCGEVNFTELANSHF